MPELTEIELSKDLKKYKHKFPVRVRNYHVDSQGVVHNAIYLEYCETGRVEYIRELGFGLIPGGMTDSGLKVMVKRNEVTYYSPARFDYLILVYSRISYIKNTSFCFDHILINSADNTLLCDQRSIHVNLDPKDDKPARISDHHREVIKKFEKANLILLD